MPPSDAESLIACDDDAPVRPVAQSAKAHRIVGTGATPLDATTATEVPVALLYNQESHVVMMATPADLADFALGFSLSEGILDNHAQLREIGVWDGDNGIEVTVDIDDEPFRRLKSRRRNLTGRTGCGLCGVEELAQVARPLRHVGPGRKIAVSAIRRALSALPVLQTINRETGAVHAAAWADAEGEIVLLREDVGRHNALDKLIGAMVRAEIDFAAGFAVITSRCSFEMVQKAATVGIPFLVAISAPTTMALSIAERAGVTLVALARADGMTVYANPGRLTGIAESRP
jgi:formate dehydrogenase accessory protein FdhD